MIFILVLKQLLIFTINNTTKIINSPNPHQSWSELLWSSSGVEIIFKFCVIVRFNCKMLDGVIYTRSSGVSAEGVKDQYADGKAAKVWEIFIGDKRSRTDNYRNFLINLLKKHNCKRILDVACGTGWVFAYFIKSLSVN